MRKAAAVKSQLFVVLAAGAAGLRVFLPEDLAAGIGDLPLARIVIRVALPERRRAELPPRPVDVGAAQLLHRGVDDDLIFTHRQRSDRG